MKNVNDFVDYKLRVLMEQVEESEEIQQLTLRIPRRLVARLDTVSDFIHVTRTAFITEALEIAASEAMQRLQDNPVTSHMKVNDLTPEEYFEARLLGGGRIGIGPEDACEKLGVTYIHSSEAA